MQDITLGDIATWAAFIAMLGGSVAAILRGVKKVVEKLLLPLSLDNAKNYLVPFLARVERGEAVSEIEVERFHEVFAFYSTHGGNSYIKRWVEKLQKEGKL